MRFLQSDSDFFNMSGFFSRTNSQVCVVFVSKCTRQLRDVLSQILPGPCREIFGAREKVGGLEIPGPLPKPGPWPISGPPRNPLQPAREA